MAALRQHGIGYIFLGMELGGRSNDDAHYKDGRVQYRRLAATAFFRDGLERVQKGSESGRIALMCAEREPLECHRTLLVGRELTAVGVQVVHIHPDGHLEPHADTVKRLLEQLGWLEWDLFRTRSEVIEDAYAKQEARIAFVDDAREGAAREARK